MKSEVAKQEGKYDELALQLKGYHDSKMQALEEQKHQLQEMEPAVMKLGKRYLKDAAKWHLSRMNTNNFAATKDHIFRAADVCKAAGYPVDDELLHEIEKEVKDAYEDILRKDFQRQEQARIKAKIREEQKLQREIEKELEQVERERKAIQAALEEALKTAEDEHSAEIESMRERLREAEERSARTKSRAEMTRSGYVYVISNFGSFGDEIFKIGMTRRLDPSIRVKELGDASVPFPFDVHMMISSDDAPGLESALHKTFNSQRVNRVNLRKEFFRVSLDEIAKCVHKHHGEVEYHAEPEAFEWRESLSMSEDDFAYIAEENEKFSSSAIDDD